MVELRTPGGDRALISPEGAQLLSWQAGGREQLYWSALSPATPGRAVRGGVPVCFPQFSDRGPLQKHGFVRVNRWDVVETTGDMVRLAFDPRLAPAAWPHPFALGLTVRLGEGWIEVGLEATNTGTEDLRFTAALHTYLAVPDVRQARVEGLQGCDYEDALDGLRVKREQAPAITFDGELDRVYRNVPASLALQDGATRRITQAGFVDTVVWNPGPAKAAALGDMPPGDWLRMVCIEAAVAAAPVRLAPGRSWSGSQRIALNPA
ncbi:D-hexose-6-phosphate mutarotase [Ramlibacter sp. XY19]|uniref:D-hexose-6-phosphate mutarotase n=1 Tax=Ramlibacter paludis TaxID=2908000 RepID=UPI0023DA2A04|nr:D-hexose-6-phosphate mutarotase [Ramlibacter paludis]MCG2592038.1 D-hexose-6-phosphate mutarotase [Ramlibacter paludis]